MGQEPLRVEATVPADVGDSPAAALVARARAVLDAHWQPAGYTVPNASVYPHQWLWDSCFHAVVWAHLGRPDRAVAELRHVFAHQADDGFLPHMTYWTAPDVAADFWGRRWTSCLTQPPMYGHALAELARLGVDVGPDLVGSAVAGLRFVLTHRERDGLVVILHPWESGCDDSPRWDSWYPQGVWHRAAGRQLKGDLVAALRFDPVSGSPVGSDRFEVASVAFNALVAFNVAELATVTSLPADVVTAAGVVTRRLRSRWDPACGTFVDHSVLDGGPRPSSRARTLEALSALLACGPGPEPEVATAGGSGSVVSASGTGDARCNRSLQDAPIPIDDLFGQWRHAAAFGGPFGPAQVHRGDPAFDPDTYWRGPAWPQLNYLCWLAARRAGRAAEARALRDTTVAGALRSGFAEK